MASDASAAGASAAPEPAPDRPEEPVTAGSPESGPRPDPERAPAPDAKASGEKPPRPVLVHHKRTFMEKVEGYVSQLSTRSNFWHRLCAWIWLPFAYHSGIKMLKESQRFSAVLPFRRFNKNWYKAMAGAALLGNSEIAGGMYVFNECGGEFGVVCKRLEYRFLRPCVGPAIYTIHPTRSISELAAGNREFNVTLEMEIYQMMRTPQERGSLVGRCTATFHATSIAMRKERERLRLERRRTRKKK
jgi:hypothetical protein